jgi:hypothetical protein
VRLVAIRRNPGFDVFNVCLLIGLDKLLREKRRYQGDLSASINDALLAVNLNTVKLVALQGKKKQTARETQVVPFAFKHADDVLVYDNTTDGKAHWLVARFIAGELVKTTQTSPEWLKSVIGRELRSESKQQGKSKQGR